jgi:uncharacterized protein (DUF2141 family)
MSNAVWLLSVWMLGAAPLAGEAPTAAPAPATSAGIDIDVWGMTNDKGTVRCVLFASSEGFPGDWKRGLQVVAVKPAKGAALCHFAAPKAGTYAVSVLHDENDNGKMDANFVGIPWEGVGCTRDARSPMGPPHFDDAKFSYSGGAQRLRVHVNR